MADSVQEKASVGAKELTAMMTLFVASNAFLSYPRYVSDTGMEAAWIEPLISGALTLILFLIAETLLQRFFPGLDIVEAVKSVFGRVVAVFVALVVAAYFLLSTADVMRQFTENVITTVLPTTPILIVSTLFMFVVCFVAYTGLEGVARTSYFVRPILVIGTLGLCLLTANWWIPSDLLPFWGSGWFPVTAGGFRFASVFVNVLLLCIIFPHAHDPRSLRRVGVVSVIASSLLLCAFMLTYELVFPALSAGDAAFPMYQLARIIAMGRYVQHLESIFVFLWVAAAVVKMAITLWGAAYLLATACAWPTFRPAIAALGSLIFAGSLLPANVHQVVAFDRDYLLTWGWTIVFGLPLLVLFASSLRQMVTRGRMRRA